MKINYKLIIFISFFVISGCISYSFHGGSFPEHTNTINIPIAENQSTMYGLEQLLTSTVRDQFLKDGRLSLSESENANIKLLLKVIDYRNEVYSYTSEEEIKEYEISIQMSVTYINQSIDDTIWLNKVIIAKNTYSAYNEDEEIGKERVIEDFSKDLISLMTENW